MHRMLQRGAEFGLDYFETEIRATTTAKNAIKSRCKHATGKFPVYYQYFCDGLAFYVVCKERECVRAIYVRIITVIIEQERE